MSDNNSKFNQEIDAGKFFLGIFYVFLVIGVIFFLYWFFTNVYDFSEAEYIKGSRYAYSILQDEVISTYEKQKFVFDENSKGEDAFCKYLANKYGEGNVGYCTNYNPLLPTLNFTFKGKNMTVYGLEKPTFSYLGIRVKDIVVDVNGENKGDNQVGKDRVILRIYSSGANAGFITPVNCSSDDEKNYGLKKSLYCIGSMEIDYLITNKPLGFDIQQIGSDNGKTRIIGSNLPFLRADCSIYDGMLTGGDDYCEEKMLYSLRGCDDDYVCNIKLSKSY